MTQTTTEKPCEFRLSEIFKGGIKDVHSFLTIIKTRIENEFSMGSVKEFILNFDHVEDVDNEIIAALKEIARAVAKGSGKLILDNVSDAIVELFAMYGAGHYYETVDTMKRGGGFFYTLKYTGGA